MLKASSCAFVAAVGIFLIVTADFGTGVSVTDTHNEPSEGNFTQEVTSSTGSTNEQDKEEESTGVIDSRNKPPAVNFTEEVVSSTKAINDGEYGDKDSESYEEDGIKARVPKQRRFEEDEETEKQSPRHLDLHEALRNDSVTVESTLKSLPVTEASSVGRNAACDAPLEIEGAVTPDLEGTEYTLGMTITYQCSFGYVSRGSGDFLSTCKIDERTGEAKWTKPNASCISRSCGDPGYVVNARRIGNLFTFPNKVDFVCEEGYKLQGLRSRYCQASGVWSGKLPSCETVYCSVPPHPENGRVRFSSLDYGSELTYECNKGFILNNKQPRTCTNDGTWSNDEPKCLEARCKKPESPERGSVQLLGEPKAGSLALYSCDEGLTMFGTPTSKCLITGEWTFDPPKCFRSCRVNDIRNGKIGRYESVRYISGNRHNTRHGSGNRLEFSKLPIGQIVKHNETATLKCNSGFIPANLYEYSESDSEQITCIDGLWNATIVCREKLCLGHPPAVENASPVIGNRSHGAVIWYRCDDDFVKAKSGKVFCDHGTWKGNTPTCADTRCYTNQLNFEGLRKPKERFVKTRSFFKIECGRGYKKAVTKEKIRCVNGQWDTKKNPCKKETCDDDPPSVANGRPLQYTREHGSSVQYECDEHFQLVGTSDVRCEAGKWEGQIPFCQESVRDVTSSVGTSTGHGIAPGLLHVSPSPNPFDPCFCTYDFDAFSIAAAVKNRRLAPGERVEKGEIVTFSCPFQGWILQWENGMIIFGTANLTCRCENLTQRELPRCLAEPAGASAFLFNDKMKILPGGKIEVMNKEPFEVTCRNRWSQPNWYPHPHNEGSRVTGDSVRQIGYYTAIMHIPVVDNKNEGRYECFSVFNSRAETPSVLELQISAVKDVTSSVGTSTGHGIAPELLPVSPSPNPFDPCFCTYDFDVYTVAAAVKDRRLAPSERVEKGEIVTFSCLYPDSILQWENGMIIFGTAILTCRCEHLTQKELPRCLARPAGASAFLYNDKMKILPGGKIEVMKKEPFEITCVNPWSQPNWYPYIEGSTVTRDSESTRVQTGYYTATLHIPVVDNKNEGRRYECFSTFDSITYTASVLELQIAELEIQCPELRTNTSRGNFFITYENDRKVNSLAYYACRDNSQKLTGEYSRSCLETGKWSATYPSCEDITCWKQPTSNGLVVSYTNSDKVNSIAKFRCSGERTLVGVNATVCQPNGQWSNPWPICELFEIRCPELDKKGIFTIQYNNNRRVNSTAHFYCKKSHQKVEGCNFMTCQQNGQWSGTYPTCVDYVNCPKFEESMGLEVSYSDGLRVRSVASFYCQPPNKLLGNSYATCRFNGTWSQPSPICEAPKCSIDDLWSSLPEGVVADVSEMASVNSVPLGTEIRLFCEDDMIHIGSPTATCEALARWDKGDVQCVPGCRLNKNVESHLLIEPVKEYYRFGDFILLSCLPGQKLTTDVERVMCMGKKWSHELPECTEVTQTSPSGLKERRRNA